VPEVVIGLEFPVVELPFADCCACADNGTRLNERNRSSLRKERLELCVAYID
jgi:hypothetical protein